MSKRAIYFFIVLFFFLGLLVVQNRYQDVFFDEDLRLEAAKEKEQEAFRRKLQTGVPQTFEWPGLRSAQVSWAWLELLQGVHVESSYNGDFSWMFAKLHFVAQRATPVEVDFLGTLAPFYFVIGKDGAGSTLFLHELITKSKDSYQTNFWAGYHAMDNLLIPKMAAYFYEKASLYPQSPPYLAVLSQRLRLGGYEGLSPRQRGEMLKKTASPQILEKIKQVRPEWF